MSENPAAPVPTLVQSDMVFRAGFSWIIYVIPHSIQSVRKSSDSRHLASAGPCTRCAIIGGFPRVRAAVVLLLSAYATEMGRSPVLAETAIVATGL
jgi:hypothetical protein